MTPEIPEDVVQHRRKSKSDGPHKVEVNVLRFEKMSRGRFKVKIEETGIDLRTLNFNNKVLVVIHNLGRGRFILREEKAHEQSGSGVQGP